MFTGIIEEVNKVSGIERKKGGGVLKIISKKVIEDGNVGDSIAINGVCLTITKIENEALYFDYMPETAQRTNIGGLNFGDLVNLERSLKYNERLGGHLVSGHIDFLGVFKKSYQNDNAVIMHFEVPSPSLDMFIEKGSIAINGISLTIIKVDKLKREVSVGIIPHTLKNTNLFDMKFGKKANIEIDMISKYVKNYSKRYFNS